MTSQSKAAEHALHTPDPKRTIPDQIHELRIEGLSGSEIAKELKRSKATISRELKRNAGTRCWKPLNAHNIAQERQTNCRNARRIADPDGIAVEAYIRLDCSPEQAIARLALECRLCASSV